MEKICKICSSSFETNYPRKFLCSPECVLKHKQARTRTWVKANLTKVRESGLRAQRVRIENGKFKEYQVARRSSKAGYTDRFLERIRVQNPASDVTRDYLFGLFGDTCAITAVAFKFDKAGKTSWENPYSPSIDRINSKLPYQIGNIQIVLSAVNFAKNAMSMEDFTQVWRDITKSWAALTQ